jgi:hypothetical protein
VPNKGLVHVFNWSILTALGTGGESGGNLTAVFAPANTGNIPFAAGLYQGAGTTVDAYVSSTPKVYGQVPFMLFQVGNAGGPGGRVDTCVVNIAYALPLFDAGTALTYTFELWEVNGRDYSTAASYTRLGQAIISISSSSPTIGAASYLISSAPTNPTVADGNSLFFVFYRSDSGGSVLSSMMVTASARIIVE